MCLNSGTGSCIARIFCAQLKHLATDQKKKKKENEKKKRIEILFFIHQLHVVCILFMRKLISILFYTNDRVLKKNNECVYHNSPESLVNNILWRMK